MSNSLVSVIVPVFDVVAYLEECVQSIINQSYSNLEIILVDDGSTDGSGSLCDELKKIDSRIVVYHKRNGGLSDARNYGLERCTGQWVSFVDSDDYLSPIFLEVLLEAALVSGCPISAVPHGKDFLDGCSCELVQETRFVPSAHVVSSRELQRLLLYQRLDTGVPWRLYSKEILESNPFPVGLYYEDLASVYRIIHAVDDVALVDCCDLYAYRLRSDSIIRQAYRPIKAKSALSVSHQLYSEISSWYPDLAIAAASRCFSVCRMVYAQIVGDFLVPEEVLHDRKRLWQMLKMHRCTVLCDCEARKRERFAAFVACLGEIPFKVFCVFCRKVGFMR